MWSVSKREASRVRPRVFLEMGTEEGWHHPLLTGGPGGVEGGGGGSGAVRSGFDRVKHACHLDVRVEVRRGQLRQRG